MPSTPLAEKRSLSHSVTEWASFSSLHIKGYVCGIHPSLVIHRRSSIGGHPSLVIHRWSSIGPDGVTPVDVHRGMETMRGVPGGRGMIRGDGRMHRHRTHEFGNARLRGAIAGRARAVAMLFLSGVRMPTARCCSLTTARLRCLSAGVNRYRQFIPTR